MKPVRINEDNIFTWITGGNWVLLAVFTLGGLLLFSPRVAGSVLVGGLLAMLNFYWLVSVLRRVLQLPVRQATRFAQARYILRLTALGLVLFTLIKFAEIDILGLLVGLSITVLNIIALAFYKVVHKGG